jgi:hypothetical protein
MLLRIAEDHLGKVLEVLNLVLGDCHSFLSEVAFRHEGCDAGLLILSGLSLGWPPSLYERAPALGPSADWLRTVGDDGSRWCITEAAPG